MLILFSKIFQRWERTHNTCANILHLLERYFKDQHKQQGADEQDHHDGSLTRLACNLTSSAAGCGGEVSSSTSSSSTSSSSSLQSSWAPPPSSSGSRLAYKLKFLVSGPGREGTRQHGSKPQPTRSWVLLSKYELLQWKQLPSILKSCHQVTKKLPHFVVLLMPICSEYVLLIGCLEVHTLQCRTFHRCHHQNAPLGLCLAILLWIRCFNTD